MEGLTLGWRVKLRSGAVEVLGGVVQAKRRLPLAGDLSIQLLARRGGRVAQPELSPTYGRYMLP